MDIGVNLVENYLRLTGYLTLTEFEVQGKASDGHYETLTDVDIVALRTPGSVYVGDPHDEDDCGVLLIEDPVLMLEDNLVDVIVGEVKQGEAAINPGLKDHRVLHAVLRRLDWLYEGDLDEVVEALQKEWVHHGVARGGGEIRTRIVAFGQAPEPSLNIITHTHMVRTMLGFFEKFEDAMRPLQYKDPAPALLRFLTKTGFEIYKPGA
ncbi:MAG: hypothetical protein OEM94_06560 [Acidimicrobiia bacterium]|nr:hypothetical protein [Acidimicrobiia bacterium]